MRYEAKTEQEAVEGAAKALGKPAAELKYTVIRDEKAFGGGRVAEIEVEEAAGKPAASDAPFPVAPPPAAAPIAAQAPAPVAAAPVATEGDAVAAVETTLTELLSAAGLLVETRRREVNG